MKRNLKVESALFRHWRSCKCRPTSYAIPPGSIIRVKIEVSRRDADADLKLGTIFRVGYYSKMDGLDCVWLVDSTGKYCQTWDKKSLLDSFELISRSTETDPFGRNAPQLGRIDGTQLVTMKQSLN
jgi:hypothetical protein